MSAPVYREYWLCGWDGSSFAGQVWTRRCVSDDVAMGHAAQIALRIGGRVGCWWASPGGLVMVGNVTWVPPLTEAPLS